MLNVNLLVNLCADMWEKPIAEFTTAFYNGEKAAEALNLENCVSFGSDNRQTVEIYIKDIDGRKKIIYSCNVTEIYDIPVITSIFSKQGKVHEADFNTLYDEISANIQ